MPKMKISKKIECTNSVKLYHGHLIILYINTTFRLFQLGIGYDMDI